MHPQVTSERVPASATWPRTKENALINSVSKCENLTFRKAGGLVAHFLPLLYGNTRSRTPSAPAPPWRDPGAPVRHSGRAVCVKATPAP